MDPRRGPSNRFEDFTTGTNLFARGYTYVMVDLRGFGGSTGCLDWVGPGEQADVKAAIQWAARQPWSTGDVGMYGKSYDAVTGLVGNNLRLPRLKAVVAQEPLWNMYNYLFSNEVPRPNVTGTPAGVQRHRHDRRRWPTTTAPLQGERRVRAEPPGMPGRTTSRTTTIRTSTRPTGAPVTWRAAPLATTTPLFITQGFIENNTKPEDAELFLDNHLGVERGLDGAVGARPRQRDRT